MIRVVTRAQFPVAVRGPWSGGEADICRMGRNWGGRQGAALIAAAQQGTPSGLLLDRPAGARLCSCTDGGRNQPLASCPHCRGEGWVR
ncbi:hypothetical protein [Deinococcus gobiensis]|uniref:hypothetical protein n=1 Tax=Deinococcus gobiensis TaxID=502394 RepID=UPI0002EB56FF|nr:hypothetical protein [Deinococcus gobiensis]